MRRDGHEIRGQILAGGHMHEHLDDRQGEVAALLSVQKFGARSSSWRTMPDAAWPLRGNHCSRVCASQKLPGHPTVQRADRAEELLSSGNFGMFVVSLSCASRPAIRT
jgi:hypothetical protein